MKKFETVLVNTFFTKEELSDMQDLINNGFDVQEDEINILIDALIYDNI
jgi:hypothetical protein